MIEMAFYAAYYAIRTLWRLIRLPVVWREKHPVNVPTDRQTSTAATLEAAPRRPSIQLPAFETVESKEGR